MWPLGCVWLLLVVDAVAACRRKFYLAVPFYRGNSSKRCLPKLKTVYNLCTNIKTTTAGDKGVLWFEHIHLQTPTFTYDQSHNPSFGK